MGLATCLALLLIIPLVGAVLSDATTGEGSLQLSVSGYGVVHGALQSATIYPNDTVSMAMTVNDQIQTSQGTYPITASGFWIGTVNETGMSGSIQKVVGNVHGCIVLLCGAEDFTGQGAFTGSLNASNANGTLDGTIAFTNNPGQQIPISGFWSADFSMPVPEFGTCPVTFILACVAAIALVWIRPRSTRHG